jgi:hypothetical protein
MSRYRRLKIEGGAFFYTLAVVDRGSDLLVRQQNREARKRYLAAPLLDANPTSVL